jgi:hypothetical protein
MHYTFARALEDQGAFDRVDVIFATDPAYFLDAFIDGRGTGTTWGGRSLVHPNVANFVNPFVRAAAGIVDVLEGGASTPQATRRQVALMVAPAAAAIESALVMLAFSTFGARALLLALLNAVTVAGVVFGAVPESYAFSGAGFAAVLWLASRNQPAARSTWWGLAATGLVLVGTTSTHLVPFGMATLLILAHAPGSVPGLIRRVSLLLVTVVVLTVASALAIAAAYDGMADYKNRDLRQLREAPLWSARGTIGQTPVERTVAIEARRHLRRATEEFPKVLSYTVLAAPPALDHQVVPPTSRGPETWFTYVGTETEWWRVAVVLLAIVGALVIWPSVPRSPRRVMYFVAATLLAYNWVFHTVFGYELFLYAKHWSVPLVFLLGSWLETPPRFATALTAALSSAVILVALNTWFVVQFMLRAL